jgi:hypothetical protein
VREAAIAAVSSSPFRVLVCVLKEGLMELADRAAEEALVVPLQHDARILSGQTLEAWVRFICSFGKN